LPDVLALLTAVEGIDYGEAVLMECACRLPESVLATGDKRSLQALATAGECQATCLGLARRVITFEQVLYRLIDACGYELLRDRASPVYESDGARRRIFALGEKTPKKTALSALSLFLNEIVMATGMLLVPTLEHRPDAKVNPARA
jgi:hypothetical protein